MTYESEAIDRAIYGCNMNVSDFQTQEHRIQLILAILDQWGVNPSGCEKIKNFLENIIPDTE